MCHRTGLLSFFLLFFETGFDISQAGLALSGAEIIGDSSLAIPLFLPLTELESHYVLLAGLGLFVTIRTASNSAIYLCFLSGELKWEPLCLP